MAVLERVKKLNLGTDDLARGYVLVLRQTSLSFMLWSTHRGKKEVRGHVCFEDWQQYFIKLLFITVGMLMHVH